MATKRSIEIAWRLDGVRRRYPELDELASDFQGNYQNANREVVNALERMDSEIRDPFIQDAYGELWQSSFDELRDIDYFEEITDYGDWLVLIRFCDGYIGNLAEGQRLTKNQCIALMFGYECYWREGDDFLLGIVVENHLRRIPDPRDWGWPSDEAFEGKEENRQIQWLGYTIGKEMKELARYHRLMQPSFDNFRTSETVKPPLRDFRAILIQIEAAAAAEQAANASAPKRASPTPDEQREQAEAMRSALEEYIEGLDTSRRIAVRKLMKNASFAKEAQRMVDLACTAMGATVAPAEEFKKRAEPLRPSSAAGRHPELQAIAHYYVVENGEAVLNSIVGGFGDDAGLIQRAFANLQDLRRIVQG